MLILISACNIRQNGANDKKIKIDKSDYVMGAIEHKKLIQISYDIHYYVASKENTECVFFLHPAFSDHRAFDLQVDYFSKHYKVITIDLIGHGLSKAIKSKDQIDASAEHIHQILELENIEKVHLVGVSMGSLIAQYFALKYPTQTKSLTALGGYSINNENKQVAKAQRASNLSLIVKAIFSMKAFRKKASEITCSTKNGQTLFYKSMSFYERKSFMVMQGLQNIIKDRKVITNIYPTLILTGEFDIELAKSMAEKWHADIANSKFYFIKNAGHCANIDNSKMFNQLVSEFIDR